MQEENNAQTTRDRNLLFGVIAVRLAFVAPQDLAIASKDWADDPSADLGEVLVSKGYITEKTRALITPVVDAELEEHGGDVNSTLNSFGGDMVVHESFAGSIEITDDGVSSLLEPAKETAAVATPKKTMPSRGSALGNTDKITLEHPGRYSIKREYGKGGIGRVLLAYDEHIGREVALKELIGQRVAGTVEGKTRRRFTDKAMTRFLLEARVTGQLEHPGIVPVYEVGRKTDGSIYYTMKLVRGKNLWERLRGCKSLSERLMLLSHFVDLCQSMAYAHSKSVIHRDIKPQNVVVGEFGETVVLDWGLAKIKGIEDERAEEIEEGLKLIKEGGADETVAGSPLGTPSYMSPEQAEGMVSEIDERSDVWSLGAVLYEFLTGQPPFTGVMAYEVMGKVIKDPVVPVRELEPNAPPELCAICEKCLEKDRDQRYQDAGELNEDVVRFQAGSLVSAYEYSMSELVKRWINKHKRVVITASVATVILIIFASWSFVRIREQRNIAVEQKEIAEKNESIADKQRQIAEQRKTEAEKNLAQAYYQYGLRAENETRWNDARMYYAKSLEMGVRLPARNGLYRESVRRIRPILEKSFPGGEQKIRSVDFSPSGNYLVTGSCSEDDGSYCTRGEVKLYCLRTIDNKKPGALHDNFSTPFPSHPDGRRETEAGVEYSVRTHGKERIFKGHDSHVWSVAFSPDGRYVISGGDDWLAILWSVFEGPGIHHVFRGHEAPVRSVDISPDGKWALTGSADKFVKLWSIETGKLEKTLKGHQDMVLSVAFSPDTKSVLSGSVDTTIKLWSTSSGKVLKTFSGHQSSVYSVSFSRDGEYALSASADMSLKLWSIKTGKLIRTFTGHEGPINSAALSADNKYVLSCAGDKTMKLWSTETGRCERTFTSHDDEVYSIKFSPDGNSAASASWDGTVKLWNIQVEENVKAIRASDQDINSVAVSPDSKLLLSGGWDTKVKLWSVDTGELQRTFAGHNASVKSVAFSPDSKLAISASNDHQIKIWSLNSGELLRTLSGHQGSISSIALSPDGKKIISASHDDTLKLWSVESGECIKTFEDHEGIVTSAAYSPDGKYALSGSEDMTVKLWSIESGECLKTFVGHQDIIHAVAFTPDMQHAVSAAMDESLKLWSLKSGDCIRTFAGHNGAVNSVAVSRNSKYVFSGSNDNTVKLWSISTGENLLSLAGHGLPIYSVGLSGDGKYLVSGSMGIVTVWTMRFDIVEMAGEKLLANAENETGLVLEGFNLQSWMPGIITEGN